MEDTVLRLSPAPVWRIFAGMSAVPRPSKREEKIRAHIHALAAEHGLVARQDAIGNIVIEVPATPGYEHAPTVVIQGHLDMVCEKNRGTTHDFDRDPIRLSLEKVGDETFVKADGTTLGADNGIGVALGLAAATSADVVHGPLELLLTTDEEQGMTGAKALVPESFSGRVLINLDSEEDDALYIGCAGGCDTSLVWRTKLEGGEPTPALEIHVGGLRGGHSGCDIHQNRGNAIQLLARLLRSASAESPQRIVSITGGNLRNAIPREATAVVFGARGALDRAAEGIREAAHLEHFERGMEVAITNSNQQPTDALSVADTQRLLDGLVAIPSGVISMHPNFPTLVQNSNNLSVITSTRSAGPALEVQVNCMSRSATMSCLELDKAKLAAIGRATGAAAVTHSGQYAGWEPKNDSALLATCRRVYRECFDREPRIAAIHAGLECGIIGSRVDPTMEMISFGPNITGAHSPDERVSVESVARIWTFLQAVLKDLAER
ncbi:MAG: beta-Ala-His dipeptidase [Planctomycetota bacterium]